MFLRVSIIFLFISIYFYLFPVFQASAAVLSKPSPNLGLVGYWSFNEGTSTIALDYSGNKNKGTLVNGPKWVDGKRGKALNFDNVNDQVIMAPNSSMDFGTETFTVSAWVYSRSFSGTFVSKTQTNLTGWDMQCTTGGRFNLRIADTEFFTVGGLCITGVWQHFVAVKTGGTTVALYINGVAKSVSITGQSNDSASDVGANERIGTGFAAGSSALFHDGIIDEVRVYNRALSANEIQALYNSGAAKFAPPSNTGLVGYWSFNEGTSTVALDYSGNKNKGTLVNGPTWVDGKRGKALNFDGGDDYISAGNSGLPTGNFTYSLWVNLRDNTDEAIIMLPDSAGGNELIIYAGLTNGRLSFATNDAAFTEGTTDISTNTWNHIALVRSGSSIILYLNTQSYVTGTDGVALTIECSILFGVDVDAPTCTSALGNYMNGLIDDVRVYNRALSVAEVAALYNVGAAKFAPPSNTGLVGYWSFNEGTSTIALDYSGNKNKGTLTNGPTWVDGKRGKALNFDGSNDYVGLGNPTSLQITGDLTITAWIKLNGIPASGGGAYQIVAKDKDTGGRAYTFDYYNEFTSTDCPQTHCLRLYINGGAADDIIYSSGELQVGRWYFVTGVYDNAGTLDLYIDGVSVAAQVTNVLTSIPTATANVLIGMREYVGFLNPFNGLIDEVRVYNRALSPDEVRQLYNSR